jgi:1-acyl-sn-glycerol-3-phosphate acyltransferase
LLYYILRPFIYWCLHAWFKNIVIVGKENLELEGPIIYVSNHPNAALDPLLLAINQKPKLFYLAAAEWFGKGFKNYVFRKHFNMIPLGRPWLKLGEEVSNEDVFEQCYQGLAEGKRIVIYPEGSSVTVANIREIKTGAARIKLGGDAFLKKTNAKWQDVKIIPLGLNYYQPRKFQSDVVMHFGDPIDFGDIQESNEQEQVRRMTERIREKMSELVFHFEKDDFRRVAMDVYLIYGGHLRKQLHLSKDDLTQTYLLKKGILDAAHFFHENEPEKLQEIDKKIRSFKKDLKDHKLDLRYMKGYRWPTFLLIRLIFGLPFFLVGWILNVIPFLETKWAFEKYIRPKFTTVYVAGQLNPSFIASMVFIIGMAVFLIWYLIVSIGLVAVTGHAWLIPLLIVVGYALGVYAARYARMWYDFVRMVRVINRRRRRPEAYKLILAKWNELIRELDNLKLEYEGVKGL